MPHVPVGELAPSFRLPSAQGTDVALEDYRGSRSLVVWFTKGMGCPFCRSQMSQLARAYQDIRKLGAEVIEITVSPPQQAKLYARKFTLPFPYLCDPDRRVRAEWGLELRKHGPLYYASNLVKGMTSPKVPNDYGDFMPPLGEFSGILGDDDMGLFLVDRQGLIRYATAGSYMEDKTAKPIPGNEEILGELAKLA